MAEILDVTGDDRDVAIGLAATALREALLVVMPTDTVYGVAADAFDPEATARIFAAKERARAHPLPVLVRSQKQLPALTPLVSDVLDRLVAAYWPGPLTIVVPAQPQLRWDLGRNDGTVAVRMPLDEVALDLIRAVGPLAVTSANRSGRTPAATARDAHDQLQDAVEVYLDDGPRDPALRSTIVDVTRSTPHVLREGVVPAAEVLAVATGELDPFAVPLPEERPPGTGGTETDLERGEGDSERGEGDSERGEGDSERGEG
ncbi:L-threonylcarbamoyladenylate synthase [Nitriliruptor alkaliphilus]|uniref:L-threonylcarbamoyladenylate synthase n=1 Tax=Nitriliruptor alkaliphilus TaxID=427918 RepID=UPI0009FB8864|nr:L-threonylcarbamoyladenylate synthase [Nitriliruptor alkaliphilus]